MSELATTPQKDKVDEYLGTVARIEPEVTPLDRDGALASIAISLKRIADSLEALNEQAVQTNFNLYAISQR